MNEDDRLHKLRAARARVLLMLMQVRTVRVLFGEYYRLNKI